MPRTRKIIDTGVTVNQGRGRKTWITLEEGVYLTTKELAFQSGVPMKHVITQALREYIKNQRIFNEAVQHIVASNPALAKAKGRYYDKPAA